MTKTHLTALLTLLPIILAAQFDLSVGRWLPTDHPQGTTVNCLASYEGVLLSGSIGGGLNLSRDGGLTWDFSFERLPAPTVTDLLVLEGEILASTSNNGVFSSRDGGESWRTVNDGLEFTSGNCLATNGESVFLGTNTGVYKKDVASESWTYLPFPITGGRGTFVASLTVSGQQVIAGGSSVVYVSQDGGNQWIAIEEGFSADVLSGIILPSATYIGTAGQGIFSLDVANNVATPVREGPLSGFGNITVYGMIVNNGNIINLTATQGIVEGENTFNEGLPELTVLDLVRHENAYFVATAANGVYRMDLGTEPGSGSGNRRRREIIPADKMTVFPNPGNGEITMGLDLSEPFAVEVTLLSTQGHIIRSLVNGTSSAAGNWQRTIDLSGLNPGAYILRFITPEAEGSKFIMIQ